MEKRYCYQYPHPLVTADAVLFAKEGERVKVLLIERGRDPFKGCWAFPGGFLEEDETIDNCARRELMEETGIELDTLQQLHVFSDPLRDTSRESRVITVAFVAVTDEIPAIAQDDAAKAKWWYIDELPQLAFDHQEIFNHAIKWLNNR